jgi:hypothetical protein
MGLSNSIRVAPFRRRPSALEVAAVTLVAAGAIGYLFWAKTRPSPEVAELNRLLAEMDQLDPRWRLEEIEADRVTPPPGRNAAEKVLAVRRLRTPEWLATLYRNQSQFNRVWPVLNDPTMGATFREQGGTRPNGERPKIQLDRFRNFVMPWTRLNQPQLAAVNELTAAAGPALAEARSLLDTPHGRHDVTFTLGWFSAETRTYANREAFELLQYDSLARGEAGDADGAVRSCHAAFHAACSIGDEPVRTSQISRESLQGRVVNLLVRALAQGEPSDAVLTALQTRIEAAAAEPLFLYTLRGERACRFCYLESLRNAAAAQRADGKLPAPPAADNDRTTAAMARGPDYIASQEVWYLRHMNELVQIAKLPPEQWAGALDARHATIEEEVKSDNATLLTQHLAKEMTSAPAELFRLGNAQLRCAIVGIAAERFRRLMSRWPVTPDELVAVRLLTSVPTDPYAAGQSIKLDRRPNRLHVCTAHDAVGARSTNDKPAALQVVFVLYDAPMRRQPPEAADAIRPSP